MACRQRGRAGELGSADTLRCATRAVFAAAAAAAERATDVLPRYRRLLRFAFLMTCLADAPPSRHVATRAACAPARAYGSSSVPLALVGDDSSPWSARHVRRVTHPTDAPTSCKCSTRVTSLRPCDAPAARVPVAERARRWRDASCGTLRGAPSKRVSRQTLRVFVVRAARTDGRADTQCTPHASSSARRSRERTRIRSW